MKRRSTPQKDLISLEDNTAEANRYKKPSSTKNYFLETKAVEQSDTIDFKMISNYTTQLWMCVT